MQNIADHLKVSDPAPPLTVENAQGQAVDLTPFWSNGPTLLSFLRHFGCIHCRNRLAQLEQHRDQLQGAGLQLLTLALGEPKHAERYCGRLAPHLDCFAATSNDVYYAWGLRQGTSAELMAHGMDIMKASAKAFLNGRLQGTATGDAHMLPGTFIVDRKGIIQYAYYSQYAGDDPAFDTLVAQAYLIQKQGAS